MSESKGASPMSNFVRKVFTTAAPRDSGLGTEARAMPWPERSQQYDAVAGFMPSNPYLKQSTRADTRL
jgi:hypothetical protein